MRDPLMASVAVFACLLAPAMAAAGPDPDTRYAPSPAFPMGRMNPEAPPELEQFSFMIGEFDCVDQLRQRAGSWKTFPAIWNAHYFLNGLGIQDEYWTPVFFTSNIRIYDPEESLYGFKWHSGGDTPGWKSTCRRRR